MKNATALMLCLFFMFGFLVPSANAVRLYKKGYEVDIAWKEKTKGDNIYLVIWGDMYGGAKPCNLLAYTFQFKNVTTGKTAKPKGTIKRYHPDGRNNFKKKSYITYQPKNKFHVKGNEWVLQDHWVKCNK